MAKNTSSISTDVCIIGAGAAGITLAREFAGQRFQVCLLESGGLEMESATQSLVQAENVGHPYPRLNGERLRYFGGTTNHWGGACRPLDEIDFTVREWIPDSGWPFDRSHLVPYYKRAQVVCQLGSFAYDVDAWEDRQKSPRLPFVGGRVLTTMFQISPPTRFGKVYRDEIKGAGNIKTYLNANVVEIEVTRDGRRVSGVRVATLEGKEFRVVAKQFILATGGIENARLLLLSNTVHSGGLGNQNDLVGRYLLAHPEAYFGAMVLSDSSKVSPLYKDPFVVNGLSLMGVLTFSEEVLRREKLVNFMIEVKQYQEPAVGVESLRYLYWMVSQGRSPDNFWRHLKNVISDLDDIAAATGKRVTDGIFEEPGRSICPFRFQLEQAPNPHSRVTLSSERDRMGKNRARVDLRFGEIEKRSLSRGIEILGQELGKGRLGRLQVAEDGNPTLSPAPGHHMGTTRMHENPTKGVVDANCRVQGIGNLYIAGSSVFPTAGYANPTLTIVCLSIRLADHLKRILA